MIDEARVQQIDARLVLALVASESAWRPGATSPVGAVGLGQLMTATSTELGVDPWDAQANLHGTASYLGRLLRHYHGSIPLALAAYNAGAGSVAKYGGIPPYPETKTYVQRVTREWRTLCHQVEKG